MLRNCSLIHFSFKLKITLSNYDKLKAAVEEAKRQSRKEKRTRKEKFCLRFVRILINLIIVSLLVAGGFAIYQATKWSFQVSLKPFYLTNSYKF